MVCKIYGSAIVGGILMALASHALAHPLKTAGDLYQHMALKTVTLKAKNPAKDTPKNHRHGFNTTGWIFGD